ncbi:MAG: carboxypeptidase-like regulatory domain-containing protein, partial [bacterium]
GNITYANASSSAIDNVEVNLVKNGATVYTTTTDSSGHYNFPEVLQGAYDVYLSRSGNINSATLLISGLDALYVKLFVLGSVQIYGISILAGDVYENSPNSILTSSDDNVTPSDSLSIQLIAAGSITPSPGKWVFAKSENINTSYGGFPIPFATSGGFSNISITIGNADLVQNFTSRAYGDVNGSYTPS